MNRSIIKGDAMEQSSILRRPVVPAILGSAILVGVLLAAPTVPTDIKQPGTQPGEVGAFSTNCDSCHAGTPNPDFEPSFGWYGSMMSHAMRDPIFWATVAIAEQDFLPDADPTQRGGAGDLCLRCHGPQGWFGGRSEPTDGSLFTGNDVRGVECEACHLMVNPDPPTSTPGTVEEHTAPFNANDPLSGEAYFGSGMYVINSNGTRLGPYAEGDETANHAALGSSFHRSGDFCGTCHDVSNPAVGDLAHNHGAQVPLLPGTYSGIPGAPVEDKAAFNNPPYAYGIVERTYSEWKSSGWPALEVNDFATLPADLQVTDGIPDVAYHRAYDALSDADFVDGEVRYYTCQTCHMSAATGKGCNKNNAPVRTDLGRHDLTGGGYWMPDVINYQDAEGTLLFGGGLDQETRDAMTAGKERAEAMLQSAASLNASQSGSDLVVRVTNLTGHKLISGYPEGRRMWLHVEWYDGGNALIGEDGVYGPIGRSVQDLDGTSHQVESILDLHDTVIYQAKPGMDREWANQLLALGYDSNLALGYDRLTDADDTTLAQLGGMPPDTQLPTFHFVLNNVVTADNRIPPFGFDHDEAQRRNSLPVPASQYGNPGAGGSYQYWDERTFPIPIGAVTAEVELLYQQTSWEYVQFLWLANDGLGPFLGNEGERMLDAWLNTGMSAPLEMASAATALSGVFGVPGETQALIVSKGSTPGSLELAYAPACDAVDHNLYIGELTSIAGYAYSEVECSVGTGGSVTFDPGSGSYFFLIVANDGTKEGSYGRDSSGAERPEDVGTPICDRTRDLSGVICE